MLSTYFNDLHQANYPIKVTVLFISAKREQYLSFDF